MKVKLSLLLILFGSAVFANDLGQHGMVYPILEEDLLHVMKARAIELEQRGALTMVNETLVNDVTQKLNTTNSLTHLTKTQKERIYTLNLSDKDAELTQASNVLSPIHFKSTLLFIDATDESQLEWALKQEEKNKKIILVKGDVIALMQTHGVRFYLDQEGTLIKRLGIQQVPAKVSGDEHGLKVHEVKL